MTYVTEFEFCKEEDGSVCADPLGYCTEQAWGDDLEDALEAAHEALSRTVDESLINGTRLPQWEIGHEARRGGQVIAVAVTRELSGIPAICAADAADVLGISRSRVGQLCRRGMLESWKEGRSRMVSLRSIHERLLSQRAAGIAAEADTTTGAPPPSL